MKIRVFVRQFYLKSLKKIYLTLPLKNNIVFECESDLDDNPRAVYEYLLSIKYNKKHKLIWIVNNPKVCYVKYCRHNVIFISRKDNAYKNVRLFNYYLYTSKYFIFSHPYWFYKRRKEQIVVHVSHGTITKGLDQLSTFDPNCIDYLICPSSNAADKESLFWNCPREKIVFFGFPRIDFLTKGDKNKIFSTLFNYRNEKVIICMPTYKQSLRVNDSNENDSFSLPFVKNSDELYLINHFLMEKNIHLIIKPHPLQRIDLLSISKQSNIHYILNSDLFDKQIILYELIGKCDALITDLSSVYIDYLILNRPIAFLMENIKNYKRGYLYENYLDLMPGVKITTTSDFYEFCNQLIINEDYYSEERKKVLHFFNENIRDNNSKRFIEWLFSL